MTREEFIGAYNIGHRDGKAGDYSPNDYDDIFHLEEPRTDDYISREKTLEKFCDYVGAGMSMNDFDALYDIVSKMPSVQPRAEQEPKTGHWIEDFKNSVMCSCCKQQFHWEDYDYDRKEWITTHDRCPFCGAEMEVSE